MLTLRMKGLQQSYELRHRGELLKIHLSRAAVRRGEPIEVRYEGPASFRTGTSRVDRDVWCRIEHGESTLLFRAMYAATSTSDRVLVSFDSPRDWHVRWIRPEKPDATVTPSIQL